YLHHVWRYAMDESARQAYDLLIRVDPSWKPFLDAAKKRNEAAVRKDLEWIGGLPSKKNEWRAFWCHSARGLGKNHTWDSSIRLLKENGFNAILPNLAWGGVSFYKSSVLSEHPSVSKDGDAFDECIEACRKYGLECHVWKVCWRMRYDANPDMVKKMVAQGRTQVGFKGEEKDKWLCPSHPDNLKCEIEAFAELARKGPSGIHFDYIRYPDQEHCFCGGCRERFESRIGKKVKNWPKDVRADKALAAQWTAFRCSNITALVKGVHERVKRESPNVQISAAVFHSPKTNPGEIGQDWVSWCREGYLDFVCPMDYYGGSNLAFKGLVNVQIEALQGCNVKMRPGLGLSCWKDLSKDAITMARQIMIVREANLDGFCVFNFDSRAEKVLPLLHTGPTK
ncbi:MAG: family 10 glycosylhydrolase, partial [Kiritimatiellae bacterium]|nr:family 10 glycosylhydrolase [Kiritimatiellia bacterium]